MEFQWVCDLFSEAYRRLSGLPGFPWPTEAEFIQNWTDYFYPGSDLTSSLPVQTKLETWTDRGRDEVYRALEQLTRPGKYPAFFNQFIMKKVKRLLKKENLEDSAGFLLGRSGSGQNHTIPQIEVVISPQSMAPERVPDYETVIQSPVDFTEDADPDPSIISCTGESMEVMETAGFNCGTLIDQPVLPPIKYVNSCILDSLIRVKKGGRGGPIEHPKKEYFRCQHIRALKKSIRQIRTGKIPGASIHKVNRNKASHMRTWEEMRRYYLRNQQHLDELAETTSGPVIDGIKRREEGSVNVNAAKSYNDSFVSFFFSSETIRTYNCLFTDLVYDCTPEEICMKMKKTKCCEGQHSENCVALWKQVCDYAKEGMWRELERRPQS